VIIFILYQEKLQVTGVFDKKEHGTGILAPKLWNTFEGWEESFWQDYFNYLPKAVQCFKNEVSIMLNEEADYIKQIDQKLLREPFFISE